jgi:L-amino acid N-acyltransferase YncA
MSDTVRPASDEDAAAIAAVYEPWVRETAASFEIEPPGADEMRRRITGSLEWLVLERSGSVVGYAYANPLRSRPAYAWSVELSIYVDTLARGSGVGRALLGALTARLVSRGFVNAFAGITLPNAPSVALFESFGFVRYGVQRQVGFKLGAWHDVGWWQHELRAATIPPPDLSG